MQFTDIGIYLAGPLVGGVLLGLFLDNWLHTKPIFVLIFIVVGSIATFYNLIKLTRDKDAPH